MKRLFILLSPMVFIFFTACGGDNATPPPPPPPAALTPMVTPEVLAELQNKAEQMKQACAGTAGNPAPYTRYIGQVAAAVYVPPGASVQGAGYPQQPQPQQIPVPDGNACTQALLNFTTDFFTAGNGQYYKVAMPWYEAQIKGVVTRSAAILQSMGMPITTNMVNQLQPAIQGIWQQVNQGLVSSGLPANQICQVIANTGAAGTVNASYCAM